MADLTKLRQALTIEAKHHYPNLKGNQSHFSDFVSNELLKLLKAMPEADRRAVVPLKAAFDRYTALSGDERATVVAGPTGAIAPSSS